MTCTQIVRAPSNENLPIDPSKNFICSLPDEVLLNIFSRLGLQDLCSIRLVDRRFSIIGNDDILWKPFLGLKFFSQCKIGVPHQTQKIYFKNLISMDYGIEQLQMVGNYLCFLKKNLDKGLFFCSWNTNRHKLVEFKIDNECLITPPIKPLNENHIIYPKQHTAVMMNIETGEKWVFDQVHEHEIIIMEVIDGKIFTADTNDRLMIWSINQDTHSIHILKSPNVSVTAICYNDKYFFTSSKDLMISTWNIDTLEKETTFQFEKEWILPEHDQTIIITEPIKRMVLNGSKIHVEIFGQYPNGHLLIFDYLNQTTVFNPISFDDVQTIQDKTVVKSLNTYHLYSGKSHISYFGKVEGYQSFHYKHCIFQNLIFYGSEQSRVEILNVDPLEVITLNDRPFTPNSTVFGNIDQIVFHRETLYLGNSANGWIVGISFNAKPE